MTYSKEPITPGFFTKAASMGGGGGKSGFDPTLRAEPVTRLKPNFCCDFCADDNPVWVYHSMRRADGRPVVPAGARVQRWAACEGCATAIDAEDWDSMEKTLVSRLRKYLTSHMPGSKKAPENLVKEAAQNSIKSFRDDVLRIS
jgi:hypothetical protein